jgi:dihydrofolate reductase
MRARTSVFIATSLDGFIARTDGSLDWLNDANAAVPEGEDCGYQSFIATVDVLVMGRNTFEQVLTFDSWPYEGVKVVVLTHRPLTMPAQLAQSVSVSSERPEALLARLTSEGANHVYVDGGRTIQSFLAEDLIDRLTITVIPVLIGTGRPLFAALPNDQKFHLESIKAYDFGFVQSSYRTHHAAST